MLTPVAQPASVVTVPLEISIFLTLCVQASATYKYALLLSTVRPIGNKNEEEVPIPSAKLPVPDPARVTTERFVKILRILCPPVSETYMIPVFLSMVKPCGLLNVA